jgi:V8-like Glu-specific endopeptidase
MKNPPDTSALPIGPDAYCAVDPEDFLYIIGHPGGGKLVFSFHDNRFLERNDKLLRYRTPTEKGSSGSPVFDGNWDVVALHHKGSTSMPRLNGGDPEEANEGVCICAIREATRNSGVH